MSVYDSSAFHERVGHAYRCILSGAIHSRHFDTCFEMWDADAVAVALSRRAETNPVFADALERTMHVSTNSAWQDSLSVYGDVRNLAALSRQLIQEAQARVAQEWGDRASHPKKTEEP